MFSEIVKLVPTVDRSTLNRMFTTLNQRFSSVAKKFGQGMKNALKLGGIAAVAGAFLDKLLNPLQKAEEIIDRILNKGDDAVTNADEFGSDPGKLLRLEAVAAAKGVDAETLRTLLGKFQGELAKEQEAAKDPNAKPGLLRDFVDETDMADAFFKFVQSLQALEPSRRTVVQSEVFGEKIRGRASEFFNATDFADVLRQLPSSETLAAAAKRAGALSDKKDLQTAIRNSEDFVKKSGLVEESQINAIDQSERNKLIGEDETLKRFDSLKSTSIAIQELTHKFDKFTTDFITDVAPQLVKATNEISKGLTLLMPFLTETKEWAAGAFEKTIEVVANITTTMENLWGEFKSSRVYKYFGGGN